MPAHADALPRPLESRRQGTVATAARAIGPRQRRIRSARNPARRCCHLRSCGDHRRGERLARILRRRRHPASIAPAYCNRGMNLSVGATHQQLNLFVMAATSLRIPEQDLHRRCPPTLVHSFCKSKELSCAPGTLSRLHSSWSCRREADVLRRSDCASRRPLHRERERGCFPDPPDRRETSAAESPRHVVRLSVTGGVIDPAPFSKCQPNIPERN